MPEGVYPCFKCGRWFATKGQQKAHKCGEAIPVKPLIIPEVKAVEIKENKEEVVETSVEENKEEVKTSENESSEIIEEVKTSEEKEDTTFNREEAIQALKDAGIIKDKRTVSKKPDEELKEMLKGI